MSMIRHLRKAHTMAKTYSDAVNALNTLQSNFATIDAIRKSGGKANNQAIPEMLEWARRCGYQPQDFNKLNIIHVTGTKGKGSTCAFVQGMLNQLKGAPSCDKISKIGLYTSPHLKSVRERICIDGAPISEEKFAKYFFELWDRLSGSKSDTGEYPTFGQDIKPVYFRYLTLLSFHVFLQEGVDTAIYEVGVGGEYDSTNIIEKPTVTGVSPLGIDHTFMLGNTIEEIAWNKGGIFKSGAKAFSVAQPESALKVLKERAAERNAPFEEVVTRSDIASGEIKLGLPAEFQKINASLAVALVGEHVRVLTDGKGVVPEGSSLPKEYITGLAESKWAGRCQTIQQGNIRWLLDGAHTKESVTVAGEWLQDVKKHSSSSEKAKTILFFNQQTRDANALLGTLHANLGDVKIDEALFSTNVTWASGTYSADLTSLNTSAEAVDKLEVQKELAKVWEGLDGGKSTVFATIEEAVNAVKKEAESGPVDVFVVGSLHLIGGVLTVIE